MENPFLWQNGKYRMQEFVWGTLNFYYVLIVGKLLLTFCLWSLTSDPWQEKYFYAVTSITGMTQSAEEHVKDASVIPNSVLDNLDF